MNQPNLPVIAPKTAAATDTVDILAMFRRYVWLFVAGAIGGTAVGMAIYAYMRYTYPRYTASIPYSVMAPPTPIGQTDNVQIINNPDDVSQLIHRQMLLFEQDYFLEQVMLAQEFHTDKNDPAATECQWLRENKSDPLKYLKRDLVVVPKVNAASFEITMQARDPFEAYTLLKAVQRTYENRLNSESTKLKDRRTQGLQKALADADDKVKREFDSLQIWMQANHVDVLQSQYEIGKQMLQSLNMKWVEAKSAATLSKAQYDSMLKLQDEVKADPTAEIRLTPEMEQYIENDPTLRFQQQTRDQWNVELAGELTKPNPSSSNILSIRGRLAKLDEEITETRAKLRKEASERLMQMAKTDSEVKEVLATQIDNDRRLKEQEVSNIGQSLLEYQHRADRVKELQDISKRIGEQYNLSTANKNSDDVRVSAMVEDPVVPNIISSPLWYIYLFTGLAVGTLTSVLMAYLLVLTDTRVRTPRDITRSLQLPLLGFVPDETDDRTLTSDIESAIVASPASMVAESFRQIRSHITAQTAHNPLNTLVVASISPGGGSTTVAANLAAAMALNDQRVLLVDTNFYRPGLSRIFTNIPQTGFADAVNKPETLDASIVPHPSLPSLHLLGAGNELAGASSELFEGKAFRELVDKLKARYDLVIFDGAPLSLVSDSLALASRADGIVSVVRAGKVSRGAVSRIREQLRGVHANLLGFVLNAAQTSNTGYFKENYRTFYRYAGEGRRTGTGR